MTAILGAGRRILKCYSKHQHSLERSLSLSSASLRNRSSITLSYDSHDEEKSSNPPVIICHGLFGNRRNWRQFSKELNLLTGRRVIAVDAVNHGLSSHHPDMSYHDMAEDLINFLDSLDIERSLLVGHSMGGKTVMTAALSFPHRFEKLVVVDIAPETSKSMSEILTYLKAMAAIDMGEVRTRKMVEDKLRSVVPSPGLLGFLLSNLVKSPDGHFSWRVNLRGIEDNYHYIHGFPEFERDVRFDSPTLFVGGGRSYYITEAERPNILRFFPDAEIVKIPDAGHWVHSEKPKEFFNAVAPFIS